MAVHLLSTYFQHLCRSFLRCIHEYMLSAGLLRIPLHHFRTPYRFRWSADSILMCAHERSSLSAYHRSRYIHASAPALSPAVVSAFVPASAFAPVSVSAPVPASAFAPASAPVSVSAPVPASAFAPVRIPLLFQPFLSPIPASILMLRACSYSAIFHKFVLLFFSFCAVLPLL